MAWPKSNPKRPTVEEAQQRLNKLRFDPEGAYLNTNGKATREERDHAIKTADELIEVIAGKRQWLD